MLEKTLLSWALLRWKTTVYNPLKIDVNRLMLILVARHIKLSNTQYSLLLEAEGQFLTLGSEWIGSLVKYEDKSVCFSKLFSQDDTFYTDTIENNNDECEYFVNGFINNENIFIQNYVFDATFEIRFNFEQIELDFYQQTPIKKMHVTSNPYFSFHDDIFPGFAKNVAKQLKFPQSATSMTRPYPKIIVPKHPFSSLEKFNHISTLELSLNGTENFEFQLAMNKTAIIKQLKIIEMQFFDGKTLLEVSIEHNRTISMASDYFESFLIDTSREGVEIFQLQLKTMSSSNLTLFKMNRPEKTKIEISGLSNKIDKRIRIFKFDRRTKIENFFYFTDQPTQLSVIIPDHSGRFKIQEYALLGDGSLNKELFLKTPKDIYYAVSAYVYRSRFALVKDQLHIFGGHVDGYRVIKNKIKNLKTDIFIDCTARQMQIYYTASQIQS